MGGEGGLLRRGGDRPVAGLGSVGEVVLGGLGPHAASIDAQRTVLRQARTLEAAVKNPDTATLLTNLNNLKVLDSLLGLSGTPIIVNDRTGRLVPNLDGRAFPLSPRTEPGPQKEQGSIGC